MKKWLPSEERILIQNIKKLGVGKGAEVTSTEINRSIRACVLHWNILGRKGVVKSRKNFKWDDDSKSLLEETLNKYPHNITKGFKEVADRLGISYSAVHQAFYSKSSPVYRDKLKFCFAVIGPKKSTYNRKNTKDTELQPTIPLLKRVFKKLFGK